MSGIPAHARPDATVIRVDDSVNDGLLAHWKFDEPSSGTAREVMLGAHGTLSTGASMTFGPLPPMTFIDPGVLSLNGLTTGTVSVADNVTLNNGTVVSFTIAMWARRDAADINTSSTLYDSGTQNFHWYVGFLSSNALAITNNGVSDHPSTHVITDTNWHHVAFTRDVSGTVTVYLDGVAAPSLAVGALNTPTGPKLIGNKNGGNTPLDGYIDDLRIYRRNLPAAEILRLAQGKGCVTDGTSWPAAMRELQCALSESVAGDQIWIGEGTYLPGTYRFNPFQMKNNVGVFGGFLGLSLGGNETALDQRLAFNPNAPLTTLTGDILGNDHPATFGNHGENHSVVVLAAAGVSTTLDGLRVRGGNADGAAGELSNNGGGMRAASGSAVSLSNVVFLSNRSNLNGGALFSQAPMLISATHFISNASVSGNGGAIAISGTLRLANSVFLSNTSANDAGALLADTPLTVVDGLFRNNRATAFFGGAILARQALTISRSSFIANIAGFDGGAVVAEAAATVVSSTFESNRALVFYGGGIAASARLSVTGSLFLSNTAGYGGGAIAATSAEPTTIDATTARFNRVNGANCLPACDSGLGGAFYSFGPITLTNATLTDNFSKLHGGALAGDGAVVLVSSTFAANKAAIPSDGVNLGRGGAVHAQGLLIDRGSRLERNEAVLGGAMYLSGTTASSHVGVLSGTHVLSNTAITVGGGLAAAGAVTITHASFVSNTVAGGDGGGVNVTGRAVISGSLFERNAAGGAGGDGGGAYVLPGALQSTGNVYTANFAGHNGGAAFAAGEVSARDRFVNNRSDSEGGALRIAGSMTVTHAMFQRNVSLLSGAVAADGPADRSRRLNVFNSLFTGNGRTDGGGAADMRLFEVTVQLINNTFADPLPGSTPGVHLFRGTLTVTNNVFANYGVSVVTNSISSPSFIQVDYNLFFNAPLGSSIISGTGNVAADPLFVNAGAGDYRLKLSSPAVDKGRNGAVPASVTQDLSGLPRIVNIPIVPGVLIIGTPQTVDMGAHERQLNQVNRLFVPSVRRGASTAW